MYPCCKPTWTWHLLLSYSSDALSKSYSTCILPPSAVCIILWLKKKTPPTHLADFKRDNCCLISHFSTHSLLVPVIITTTSVKRLLIIPLHISLFCCFYSTFECVCTNDSVCLCQCCFQAGRSESSLIQTNGWIQELLSGYLLWRWCHCYYSICF